LLSAALALLFGTIAAGLVNLFLLFRFGLASGRSFARHVAGVVMELAGLFFPGEFFVRISIVGRETLFLVAARRYLLSTRARCQPLWRLRPEHHANG
jgi:hypothetical protein